MMAAVGLEGRGEEAVEKGAHTSSQASTGWLLGTVYVLRL